MSEWQLDEQGIQERRAQRLKEMQKKKHRQMLFRKYYKLMICLVAAVVLLGGMAIAGGQAILRSYNEKKAAEERELQMAEADTVQKEHTESTKELMHEAAKQEEAAAVISSEVEDKKQQVEPAQMPQNELSEENREPAVVYEATATEDTLAVGEDIISSHAILIDLESGNIIAQRGADEIISPASMTKVLTVLVAAEQIEEADLDDTFTMTLDITDYSFENDCSNAGFLENEQVTVRDLFYGTILPSGADAAVGLATYVAGSHEAFVELMNQKLMELGLSATAHFTNCVGLYDEEHYCTVYDMAMIMEAALANDFCKEVMSTKKYTTSATEQHPEGITISNWFLRRIEDKDTGGEVICGKTGYVAESGSCAVSYGVDQNNREYVCATADSTSSWRCIYDHVALYKDYAPLSLHIY